MLITVFFGDPLLEPTLYNCTGTGIHMEPHVLLGTVYFTLGFVAQILYLLVLKTFWRHEPFWEHACYRIMFFLGIPDFLSLLVCAEFAGVWSILGLHPCYDMQTSYLLGCLVFGTWHMSCFYVLILAFNRSCELVAPSLGRLIFSGKPLTLVLCLPILYFIYFTFFTKPLIYNVQESTFLLNPMTEATMNFNPDLYAVYGFIFNNFFVMFFIFINYFTVCAFLLYHSCSTTIQKVSKVYRQVTLQCLVVCSCHFIGCFLYIYMQYVELPNVFHVIAQLAWIGNHGLPPFVYILFNNTIRSKISFCNLRIVRVSVSESQKKSQIGETSQKRNTQTVY